MKHLLTIAAVVEAATGLVLLVYPPIVFRLLFGADITAAGVVISRVTGIALIALGVGCWPGFTALCGMLTYSLLVTLYLLYLGLGGHWVGMMLWPAVAVHAVLTILLTWAWYKARHSGEVREVK